MQNKKAYKWLYNFRNKTRVVKAECNTQNGWIYWWGRLIIYPKNKLLILQILYKVYAIGPSGYLGRTKTLNLFNRQYYWKGMANNVRKYVARYLLCTKIKFPKSLPAGLLKPLLLPLKPWAEISVDYITPLPLYKR